MSEIETQLLGIPLIFAEFMVERTYRAGVAELVDAEDVKSVKQDFVQGCSRWPKTLE